jgi:protein-disulfide isomerase
MKKIILIIFIYFGIITNINAEIKRIVSGQEGAKITIIAYESLTCSHCADFHKNIYPKLKKDFLDTGIAKIEFRHFPLDIAALNAAKIAQCKNNESLKILESLYSNQQAWIKGNSVEDLNNHLKNYLEKEGFDINFEKCIKNKEIEDFVLNDRIEGVKKFKVNATPTIIINNEKFEKSLNYKNLKKIIEKLL